MSEKNMFEYRIATSRDLEAIWKKDVEANGNDERWIRWRDQYIGYNEDGKAVTFVVLSDNDPIGQINVLFSPECSAVRNRPMLCDGVNIANMNAFRIEKKYEGQGHISRLLKMAERYAEEKGYTRLTIGCEAKETRTLAIYLHFGYTEFVTSFTEEGELVLFYAKKI